MPEIKIKHVVSFSSEDKVHKSENILKAETYRKWKCATPGESKASIVLQFEKATQIHSIDIGNECSAFVEVLVGRSDTVKDFQVLLVASSFMSPLESRNDTHTNRVRMFGPEKLSQNLKDQKWDCVQVVCTQPFNKSVTYGLSFIKFHSPPEKLEEQPSKTVQKKAPSKLGAFTIKYEDDEEEDSPSLFTRSSQDETEPLKSLKPMSPSLGSTLQVSNSPSRSPGNPPLKRKVDSNDSLDPPAAKKDSSIAHVNRKKVSYIDILGKNSTAELSSTDEGREAPNTCHVTKDSKNVNYSSKNVNTSKAPVVNFKRIQIPSVASPSAAASSSNGNNTGKVKNRLFDQIMKKVVFVISGFVNPLRSNIREKALDMGAKYKADWDRECTHLICAFENTPKYIQVQKAGGKIVTKDWVIDCYRTKSLLRWRKYMLGKYSRSSSSESEIEDPPPRKKTANSVNGSSNDYKQSIPSPSKGAITNSSAASTSKLNSENQNETPSDSQSETEDEDAIRDYKADTDVDIDSGGDTEDEIRKVENAAEKEDSMESDDDSTSLLGPSKPDTIDLPLPDLPNFFKKRHFFIYGNISGDKLFDLERYITAYDGVIDSYMCASTKYVVTDSKWDKEFDDALTEHEDLIFVKSKWIYKCHEEQKFVPHQAFVVVPTS